MKVLSPDEMRLMDENCISRYEIPAALLMESAASSSLRLIEREYPGGSVLVICGSGNNGGDGLALARKLHSAGRTVSVILSGSPERMSPAALQNYNALQHLDIPLYHRPGDSLPVELFSSCTLIVDALLGIGLSRDVEGEKAELIRRMNDAAAPVLALDIPSGLDGLSGEPRGKAVRAERTLCFGAPKRGNLLSPGHLYNGMLSCSRISFPPELIRETPCSCELNLPDPPAERDPLGYKGSFGRVLIIGGGRNYYGAPLLAARAAYRSGAGYVSAAVPSSHLTVFASSCPEAVLIPMNENGRGCAARSNRDMLLDAASRQDCVLLGPGLSDDPETQELIRELIPLLPVPLVIDADGLNALAGRPELTAGREKATILTPHPGEQQRLLDGAAEGSSIEEVYGAACVYKGPRSRICFPDGREYINPSGSAALGTAGTGDVLAGMIAALIPWEKSWEEGLRKAVLLHGLAAQSYAGAPESMSAGDLPDLLPSLFRRFREDYGEISRSCYGVMEMIP